MPDDPSPRQDFSWLDDFRDAAVVAPRRRRDPGRGERRGRSSCSSTSATATACRCCSTSSSTSARSSPWPARRWRRSCRRSPRPRRSPETCQWATFLRNHDEVDLGRLVGHEHDEVFAAFGPGPDDAALRARDPPPAGADARQRPPPDRDGVRPAVQPARHAGHPLRRRDRHGRGPLPARAQRHPHADAVERQRRTAASPRLGASAHLRRPVISGGEFGYETGQRRGPAARSRARCSAGSSGPCSSCASARSSASDVPRTSTPATGPCSPCCTTPPSGAMLALTNLGRQEGGRRPRAPGRQDGRTDRGVRRPRLPAGRRRSEAASSSVPTATAGSGSAARSERRSGSARSAGGAGR